MRGSREWKKLLYDMNGILQPQVTDFNTFSVFDTLATRLRICDFWPLLKHSLAPNNTLLVHARKVMMYAAGDSIDRGDIFWAYQRLQHAYERLLKRQGQQWPCVFRLFQMNFTGPGDRDSVDYRHNSIVGQESQDSLLQLVLKSLEVPYLLCHVARQDVVLIAW